MNTELIQSHARMKCGSWKSNELQKALLMGEANSINKGLHWHSIWLTDDWIDGMFNQNCFFFPSVLHLNFWICIIFHKQIFHAFMHLSTHAHSRVSMQVRFQEVSCSVACYTPVENIFVIILCLLWMLFLLHISWEQKSLVTLQDYLL